MTIVMRAESIQEALGTAIAMALLTTPVATLEGPRGATLLGLPSVVDGR
jgi:hypothetical protein